MTYDETIAALERLVGERVSVAVGHGELQVVFAGMPGMLRRAEPAFLESVGAFENRPSAVFYVDGGQTGGSLPFFAIYEDLFVGLDPDDAAAGVGWAMGYTVTTVTPTES